MINKPSIQNSLNCQAKPFNTLSLQYKRPNDDFSTPLTQDTFQRSKAVSFGAVAKDSQPVKDFEPIICKPEEAAQVLKEKFGVNNRSTQVFKKPDGKLSTRFYPVTAPAGIVPNVRDFICEGIIEAYNRTKGNITMPREVLTDIGPYHKPGSIFVVTDAMYGDISAHVAFFENKNDGGRLDFVKEITESSMFKKDEQGVALLPQLPNGSDYDELAGALYKFAKNPDEISVKEDEFIVCNLERWLGKTLMVHKGSISEDELLDKDCRVVSPYRGVFHELGHLAHFKNMNEDIALYDSMNKDNGALAQEFKNNPEKIKIAKKIRDYAAKKPSEFVAEVYADILEGKKIPDDVMKLYREYYGPEIPEVVLSETSTLRTFL